MITRYGPRTRLSDARAGAELAGAAGPLRHRQGRRDPDTAPRDHRATPHQTSPEDRLKGLFDALRRPVNAQEVPGGWVPSPDEQPLFCLLDDDRLITRVNVDTDRWLAAESDDDVALTIRVSLRAASPTWASVGLLY